MTLNGAVPDTEYRQIAWGNAIPGLFRTPLGPQLAPGRWKVARHKRIRATDRMEEVGCILDV
jgi:hypothetical protein